MDFFNGMMRNVRKKIFERIVQSSPADGTLSKYMRNDLCLAQFSNCPRPVIPGAVDTGMIERLNKAVGKMGNPFSKKDCTMCHDSGARNFSNPASVKQWIQSKGGIAQARTKLQNDLSTGRMPQGGPRITDQNEIQEFIKYIEAIDAVQ